MSAFFPAGFYYKTFMWPRKAWKRLYEPVIRRAAGLGVAPTLPDPDRYAQRYAHCDVLVVGAGPAGIAAALAAADSGARVILCDEQAEFGGSLLGDGAARIDGAAALRWVQQSMATLAAEPASHAARPHHGVRLFPAQLRRIARAAHRSSRDAAARISRASGSGRCARAGVVLATGAIERPLVFPGNDRPGIMLAGAAQTYLNRYGVRVGDRRAWS